MRIGVKQQVLLRISPIHLPPSPQNRLAKQRRPQSLIPLPVPPRRPIKTLSVLHQQVNNRIKIHLKNYDEKTFLAFCFDLGESIIVFWKRASGKCTSLSHCRT